MADEKIEVEWIATAQRMLQTIERVDSRLDKQEKTLQKLSDTGKKGAEGVAGSFNKLEDELKQNEAILKKLQIGTKAFADQKAKVDQLRASFTGAKSAISGSQSVIGELGSTAIAKLGGLSAGMLAFKMILTAAIAELERAQNVRLKASETMQSVEGAIADMALNIGADNVAQARGMIEQNAPQLGVTQEGLASMLAAGISGGAKDLDEALKLSSATLKLTAGDARKAIPIMSGMLTMAATTGNRDFESTLGQLSQFQEAARGEDLSVSINNMATAMAAANTKGERIQALGSERTLEMASVMSQLLQDKDMAITGTTMRQMFAKMDAFVPKTKATLDDGTKSKLSAADVAAFSKLGTMDERVQAMRANPEIAKQFLSTIEENQGKSAVRQIVTGTDKARELETAAAAIVTSQAQAKADFDALVAVIADNTKNLQAANKSKAADQVTNAKTALEGSIIEAFNRAVDGITNASGFDSFTLADARNAMNARVAIGQDIATAAINTLEELKAPDTAFGFIPVGGQVSQQDQDKLDAQIAIIKDLQHSVEVASAPAVVAQNPVPPPVEQAVPAQPDPAPVAVVVTPQPVNSFELVRLQNEAQAAQADVEQNNTGLTRIAREERAAMAQRALLEEQNRLLAEQNALMAQQNSQQQMQQKQPVQPPQRQRPQVAPLPAATAP